MKELKKHRSIALVLYGEPGSSRNALTDDKYKKLAEALIEAGYTVETVLYHDSIAGQLEDKLTGFSAILVWVNPIEQGNSRTRLDALLLKIADNGVFVSTHPEKILKIGTKKVLYTTRHMDWGGDIELYSDYSDFEKRFFASFDKSDCSSIRVLKQYRGESGNGVYKVRLTDSANGRLSVIHAPSPQDELVLSKDEFLNKFSPYFDNEGLLVNQKWADGLINGVVRCYITGTKVSGFGYQESNALCPISMDPDSGVRPTRGRFYFSEHCGLFQDLREIMEKKWIPELQEIHSLAEERMPLLWDIDLFINDVNSKNTESKYTLCEINVSCVSPFPPSCINHVIASLARL